jgi:toxin ParE1/3/4
VKVRWSPEARRDLAEIVSFIWRDNPIAARRMRELFIVSSGRLDRSPFLGRPGAQPNTRELIPHPSYRLVYEVQDNMVWIVALVHTARQWPPSDEAD